MPAQHDADGGGKRTRRTWDSDRPDPAGDNREPANRQTADGVAPTARPDGGPRGGAGEAGRYGVPKTRHVTGGGRGGQGKTQIYRPGRPTPMADPPVGWLVVVTGPGKGNVATLGTGVNFIGRDRKSRVCLDYGDFTISSEEHAKIVYEPLKRKFYVQQGRGTNLTYVDDEVVLAPRELEPLAHVQMGHTVLRFVPLCGPGFSWEDAPDDR